MSDLISQSVRAAFALALLACWAAGTVDHARAQGPALSPVPEPFSPSAAAALQPVCEVRYWVVSSRRLPQDGVPRFAARHLDYFHVDAAGQLQETSLDGFRSSLDPHVPVCIVVHGSFTPWEALLRESVDMHDWIRGAAPQESLQVVFYTWPSEPLTTLLVGLDIAVLGNRATYNGFYLAQLVAALPPETPVSFFAHSHGARTTAAALHLSAGGQVEGYQLREQPPPRRIRAVFAAAAIDHDWFNPGERFDRALCSLEALLNLQNEDDLALQIYPLRRLFSRRALGQYGLQSNDLQALGPRALQISELDVTPLIRTGHLWNHYYRQTALAGTLVPWLYFRDETREPAPAETGEVTQTSATHILRHSSSELELSRSLRRRN